MAKKYYSLAKSEDGARAEIFIFGDITSWEWFESDVSSYTLAKELAALGDVQEIDVHINSYGGEVSEGLAIYNQLKNSKARVTTYCDGFACSIASVIFMAGNTRVMNEASLLMIHNPWTYAAGNAAELRKEADDLEVIAEASINAYLNRISIKREELIDLLDAETWLSPETALLKGFATAIESDGEEDEVLQSVKKKVFEKMRKPRSQKAYIDPEEIAEKIVEKLKLGLEESDAGNPPAEKKLIQIFKGLK